MRARDVVGRRIVAVRQERFFNKNTGRPDVALEALELEGGVVLYLNGAESHVEPFVDGYVVKEGRSSCGRKR